MRLKRALLRGRALFAVQIDSAYLHPVTATFEMTLQDGMRRSLPSSITVRATGTVSSEIVGMLEPGERPVSLVTRVHGDGLDLEIISNVDRGAPPNWPLAVGAVAIPATSAFLAWYFARAATRGAAQPRTVALPKPEDVGPAPLALTAPPQTPSDFQAPVPQTMFPAVIDQTHQAPQAQTEPIRVGHDRVAPKRLRRIVEPAPAAPAWPLGGLTPKVVGRAALRTGGLAVTAAITAISAIAAIAYVHPQVAELLMPAPIPRGSHVDVVYRLAGFGTGDYTLLDADGTPLDSGTLASHSGVLRIDVPSHVTGRPVTLRVAMTGPFGDARRELSADVLATPAPISKAQNAPRIEMFSLDRDTVAGGDLLTVRYHVVPPVGGVLLTDATGAVLASAALTPSGKSLLRIPPSDRNRDLAVVLRATGSGGGAETRIPLRVEPGPRANTANAANAPPEPIPGVNSTDIEMAVLTPRVVSGEPIRLHVPLPYDRLTISLLDPQRRVVSERQYAAAYDPVRIEAPAVTAPTTFELHASVEHGVAVNIGVYRVVVVPATHATAP